MEFSNLPSDVVAIILQSLPPKEICRFGQTSRGCYEAATDGNLWHYVARSLELFLTDTGDIKSQVLLHLRCVRWTSMHNTGIRLQKDDLLAIAENGGWNGCAGDPIMRAGVRVWGVKVSCREECAETITFRLGIVDETLKSTAKFSQSPMFGWFGGPDQGHSYSINESHGATPHKGLTDIEIRLPPQIDDFECVPTPNFYACRLVLVKERRSFEMWDSTGMYVCWKQLAEKVGYRIACSLSGSETQMEILPAIQQLEDVPKILPTFDVEQWRLL